MVVLRQQHGGNGVFGEVEGMESNLGAVWKLFGV